MQEKVQLQYHRAPVLPTKPRLRNGKKWQIKENKKLKKEKWHKYLMYLKERTREVELQMDQIEFPGLAIKDYVKSSKDRNSAVPLLKIGLKNLHNDIAEFEKTLKKRQDMSTYGYRFSHDDLANDRKRLEEGMETVIERASNLRHIKKGAAAAAIPSAVATAGLMTATILSGGAGAAYIVPAVTMQGSGQALAYSGVNALEYEIELGRLKETIVFLQDHLKKIDNVLDGTAESIDCNPLGRKVLDISSRIYLVQQEILKLEYERVPVKQILSEETPGAPAAARLKDAIKDLSKELKSIKRSNNGVDRRRIRRGVDEKLATVYEEAATLRAYRNGLAKTALVTGPVVPLCAAVAGRSVYTWGKLKIAEARIAELVQLLEHLDEEEERGRASRWY